ncbi:hypothetical protein BS17DRAFT_766124 [Gyrodon lividus]|nr:hypothetical protein BS17DRAFT_766124 [Gyrodon lividus]
MAAHVVAFWPWQSTPFEKFGLRPVQEAIQLIIDDEYGNGASASTKMVEIHNSPGVDVLAPYQPKPTIPAAPPPRPSAPRISHASMPVPTEHGSHRKTPVIIGTVLGVLLALLAFTATARCIVRRRRPGSPFTLGTSHPTEKLVNPFQDPSKSESKFQCIFKPSLSNKKPKPNRLSDESWVTRETPPPSTLTRSTCTPPPPVPQIPVRHDLELRKYAFPREKRLLPITTPVCMPSDVTVFDSGAELAGEEGKKGHAQGEQPRFVSPGEIYVLSVRVPSPAYASPFSSSSSTPPSPSFTHSPTLSPAPSTEVLVHISPTSANADMIMNLGPSGTRLSRLLASSFRDTHRTSLRTHSSLSHTSMNAIHANQTANSTATSITNHATTNVRPPTRPTVAHLMRTARSYTQRNPENTTNSLYARATGSMQSSLRFSGAPSRSSLYGAEGLSSVRSGLAFAFGTSARGSGYIPLCERDGVEGGRNVGRGMEKGGSGRDRDRDTMTTITTQDTTSTMPYLSRAGVYASLHGQSHVHAPSTTASMTISPSPSMVTRVSPSPSVAASLIVPVTPSASVSSVTGPNKGVGTPMGTPLGLKVRVSDASEHELYRERERERERRRRRARERLGREGDNGKERENDNLKSRERGWKPPGSPSSSSISMRSLSRTVSPSLSPSPSSSPSPPPSASPSPSSSPCVSPSRQKPISPSMLSRPIPHSRSKDPAQTRARAQMSPKLSIYRSPTDSSTDSPVRVIFRQRAATVSRVTVVHRNVDIGQENDLHHRGVSTTASHPTSPSPSSFGMIAKDVDTSPSAPQAAHEHGLRGLGRGHGRGSGYDRPLSTHGRTKSAPGVWVRSQVHSRSHVYARLQDVPASPPSHSGEDSEIEGDENEDAESFFSDAAGQRRRARYALRDSESVLREIGCFKYRRDEGVGTRTCKSESTHLNFGMKKLAVEGLVRDALIVKNPSMSAM